MIIDLALSAVKRTFYALMSFPLGLTWFVLFVTLLSTAFGLLFIGIGIALFWLTLLIAGGCAAFERSLMSAFLDLDVPEPERRQDGRRPVGSFLLTLRDVSYWRELVFLIARFPLGLAMFVVTVTGWSIAFSGVTSIIWVWPSQPQSASSGHRYTSQGTGRRRLLTRRQTSSPSSLTPTTAPPRASSTAAPHARSPAACRAADISPSRPMRSSSPSP